MLATVVRLHATKLQEEYTVSRFFRSRSSTAGADASVEALKLYDMKLLTLVDLALDLVIVAKKDTKSSKSIN